MEAILHYLRQHLGERILMSDLVQLSRWSEKRLEECSSVIPGRHLDPMYNIYVFKSCELLKRSDHKVGMIAEMVGYQDMDSFHAAFKNNG